MSETSVPTEECAIHCKDGLVLKGLRYRSPDGAATDTPKYRILAWHGWMDNQQTYYELAPQLLSSLSGGVELVAMDFPGHGKSSHKSLDGPSIVLMDYVYYVHEVIKGLGWDPKTVTLMGHSMGGAISLLYASAFPVKHLVVLDSLGPYIHPSYDSAPKQLRRHITARMRGKDPSSVYESLEVAVETRMQTAAAFPGNQWISKEAATRLVQGASHILPSGQLEFWHDQRLKMPSILYLTPCQVDEVYKSIAASELTQVCLLLAKDGMPFGADQVAHVKECLLPQRVETLPGSHHFHADPDTANGVGQAICTFLESRDHRSRGLDRRKRLVLVVLSFSPLSSGIAIYKGRGGGGGGGKSPCSMRLRVPGNPINT
eukprot:Nitzschia sp. Nitz4//scaffold60_size111251//92102//93436//NITZ4_004160-RA/size111251-snap-gene-0.184-mRNA-1//1//CDS//3329555603//642//frame0